MFFCNCVATRLRASLNSKKSPTRISVGFCSMYCVMSISALLPKTWAVNWKQKNKKKNRKFLETSRLRVEERKQV